MKSLVEYIARALVEDKDAVSVGEVTDETGNVTLELRVAAEERGKVIGKRGRTAHAMRNLLAVASPQGKTTQLEIID